MSVIGAGKGFPVDSRVTLGEFDISVIGGLFGSCDGTNSVTVPVTATELPIAAPAGSGLEVNMKMPSEVAGSPSTARPASA